MHYSIEGNTLIIGNKEHQKLVELKSGVYIKFKDEDDGDINLLYYNKEQAVKNPIKKCDNDSSNNDSGETCPNSKIEITKAKLKSYTLYEDYNESDGTKVYAKMTFDDNKVYRVEVRNDDKEEIEVAYDIVDGKLKIDTGKSLIYFTLTQESSSELKMKEDKDKDRDGSIDKTSCVTFKLQKPSDYPSDL